MVDSFESSESFHNWVLDSDILFRMSPHHDWFVIYEPYFGVRLHCNGILYEVVGINSMRLQTVDGRRLILTRIRHVFALGKTWFCNRKLSIFKGSNLILKCVKEKSLYVFHVFKMLNSESSSYTFQRQMTIWDKQGHMGETI